MYSSVYELNHYTVVIDYAIRLCNQT